MAFVFCYDFGMEYAGPRPLDMDSRSFPLPRLKGAEQALSLLGVAVSKGQTPCQFGLK